MKVYKLNFRCGSKVIINLDLVKYVESKEESIIFRFADFEHEIKVEGKELVNEIIENIFTYWSS